MGSITLDKVPVEGAAAPSSCSGSSGGTCSKKSAGGQCPFEFAAAKPLDIEDATIFIPDQYRHKTLDAAQRELIKASIPALQAHGLDITRTFYGAMLSNHDDLKDVFNNANQTHMNQPRALAGALLAYASNIDDLSPLGAAVELMATKHVSLVIRPEQYAIVGTHLIQAIGTILGDAVTSELAEAWTAAYWQLAEILIKRENQLYRQANGWTDWAEFRIVDKVKESEEVTSFYLEPVDQKLLPLPKFIPGQFISIQVDVPALGHRQTRQYSLSEEPKENVYRISIKREPPSSTDAAKGLISNLMHDTKNLGDVIRISHPHGDFTLDTAPAAPATDTADAPVVFIAGGIGLTPLLSMLNSLISNKSTRPISWIHGSRSPKVRAFGAHVKDLAQKHENLQVTLFDDEINEENDGASVKKVQGFVNIEKLDESRTLFIDNPATEYYVCGPVPHMSSVEKALLAKGVSPQRIHMERFGTGGLQRAA